MNINKVDKMKNKAEKLAPGNAYLYWQTEIKTSVLIRLVMALDGKIFVEHCWHKKNPVIAGTRR